MAFGACAARNAANPQKATSSLHPPVGTRPRPMCTAKWGAGRADGRARFGSWDAPTRGTPRCLATFSEVARLRGVPESVRPKIWTVRDRPRGPHASGGGRGMRSSSCRSRRAGSNPDRSAHIAAIKDVVSCLDHRPESRTDHAAVITHHAGGRDPGGSRRQHWSHGRRRGQQHRRLPYLPSSAMQHAGRPATHPPRWSDGPRARAV
jgi:hypothetical protein